MNSLLVLHLIFATHSAAHKLPEGLLESLCYVESTHNVNAIHYNDGDSNSIGVCQVKLKTAKWLGFKGSEKDLMKPENNVKYAAKYLAYQIKRYNSISKGIVAYNQGNAINLESSKYSQKVIKYWNQAKRTIASYK